MVIFYYLIRLHAGVLSYLRLPTYVCSFNDYKLCVIPDIGSMLRVRKLSLPTTANCVSWTNKPINFYLHVVDRSKVRNIASMYSETRTLEKEDTCIIGTLK